MAQFPLDQSSVSRFGLIGCGAIGSALDEGASGPTALTHAGAIGLSTEARLMAVCDSELDRAQECARRRGVQHAYSDFREMLAGVQLDAVSIATPPFGRLAMIEAVLQAGIRLIWCEKPLAADAAEAAAIQALVERAGAVLAVNYMRRWTQPVRRMVDLVSSGAMGGLQGGVAYYGKGLTNNGSHMIDLLNAVLGGPDAVEGNTRVDDDRVGGDETLGAVLHYGRDGAKSVQLIATDHRRYSIFELDLLFSAGRLRLTDKGNRLEVFTVGPDPIFPGYVVLGGGEQVAGDLANTFSAVLAQILSVRRGAEPAPLCTAAHALQAMQVIEAIRHSWRRRRAVEVDGPGPVRLRRNGAFSRRARPVRNFAIS